MSKGGAKPYSMMFQVIIHQLIVQAEELRSPYRRIAQDIIQQLTLQAKAGRSSYKMIAQVIIQQLTLRAKAGRSPKRNINQGNTLGERSLDHWRAVSAEGASEVSFSQFPFALTARQYVGIYLPRVLPWAIFRLGFQPVFAACKPSYLIVRADSSS